jgi:DNA-3-methyladenine glycosylase II
MSDDEVVEDLVQVRGIGRWTAEMFLMFNLLRPDVFPLDDLGLQKALRVSYRKKSLKSMRALGETWRPWRSVATWYLWRSLDPVPVEY